MKPNPAEASGLEGVVVADTVMSKVDGSAGQLWIRGLSVERLAARGRLEDAIALLWDGEIEAAGRCAEALGRARAAWWPAVAGHGALRVADPVVAQRSVIASLEEVDEIGLVAVTGLALAAWCAVRRPGGLDGLAPDPTLEHAQDLVRLIRGAPDPARGTALGRYLCTVCDHGMNASTFTARVVASTGSDAASAVVAAIGALKGPLHGGAPGPVLDMLDAVGAPEAALGWVEREIAAGRRIMGMGHRVYRVRDPRVAVLEAAVADLAAQGVATERAALARAVETAAEAALSRRKPDRPLKANVEFATAVLLDAIGIDRAAFTAAFAAGRVVGWLAHVREQRAARRMIRPSSRYVGPEPRAEG